MNLSPRSRRNHDYKKQKHEENDTKFGVQTARSFTQWAETFDFFAQPVINFNIKGKDQVSTKCGILFSFILTGILVYSCLFSFIQIATYERMSKSEKLEYGKAADDVYDFSKEAANLAFRATFLGTEDAEIDKTIAKWTVRLTNATNNFKFDEAVQEIPVKYCDEVDY